MGKKNTKEALADETNIIVDRIIKSGIDGIIGGFPCQDISTANTSSGTGRAGLAGKRSGLFWEMVRTVCLVRPKYWLMENVAALFTAKGQSDMGTIFGAVASCGYDIQWDCVAASTIGAPHHRARAFILAYDPSLGVQRLFPQEIQRESVFSKYENCRTVQDILRLPDHPEPLIRRRDNGTYQRLHAIGNGNPPQIIKQLTVGLK